MYRNALLAKSVKLALLAGAAASTLTSVTAFAAEGDDNSVERIEITGSRLRGTDLQGFSPVQVISGKDIQASGVANVQDLLLKNPAVGSPAISRTNSNFATSSAGVATVDLRNLGTSRTLVLVNGRRYVAGVPGDTAVDLNTIPAQFIERVEIMTGGASAVYGSDAVAGVVNIILKKSFNGVEFDAQYGQTTADHDNQETQYQLTMGTDFANGKGNIMIHGAYTDQGAVFSRDRDISAVDQASLGAYETGDPKDFFTPIRPYNSSYAPQGRFIAGGTSYTFDKDGNLKTGFDTNGGDGYNRSAARTIAIPTKRYLLATQGNYEFADKWSAFMEGTYAATQTTTELEPFPLASSDIYAATGAMPVEFANYVADPNNPGGYMQQIVRNALVPDAIYNAATDTDGDGLRDITFTKRMADISNRGNTADRDTFRLLGGIKGEIGDWYGEAYYSYGQTKESQVSNGQVNVLNFRSALEVVDDGNGGLMCRDAIARAQGCVPANIFGNGVMSAAAANYIQAPSLLSTMTTEKLAGINISGDLFELPAGYVGLAAGAEYRKEYARSEYDALQQAGLNAGNAIPRTEGEFDVKEYYTEVNVPILADMFMAKNLSVRGAVRFSDYSTVGDTTSWNVALDWAPVEEVRFRVIRAQSTRAPNINELYSPPSQDFPTGLNDPCVGVTATTPGATADACRADAGVMANIQANGAFTLNQADVQGVSGYNRGNTELKEEKGKSWTIGATVSPTGLLEDFDFSADYFDIKIDDAIVPTPRQFILNQCYGGGNASFCDFITRRATAVGGNSAGSLEYIDSAVTNSGGFATKGIDYTVNYSKDLENWGLVGQFNAHLTYTHVIDGYSIPLPGSEKDTFNGEINSPKDKAYLTLGYNISDFALNWNVSYIGKSYLDDQFLAGYDLAPESVGVGAYVYHDANLTYYPSDNYELYVGLNNVFDKKPAPIITGLPGNDTGTETAAGTYDPIGRRFYAGIRFKF